METEGFQLDNRACFHRQVL